MTKSLVIYFSMTNNTKKVAEMIAQELGADTYRIQAKQPYTSEDLNWHNIVVVLIANKKIIIVVQNLQDNFQILQNTIESLLDILHGGEFLHV